MPVIIRNAVAGDFERIRELQQKIYPTIQPFSREQHDQHLRQFPQGQLVAELDGRVVGAASSLIVIWDDYGHAHTWKEVTGNGSFTTHNLMGRTLYGAEVFVDPEIRRHGIGRSLYAARKRICREWNLRRIIAAGRLPGYHRHAHEMSANTYAMKVIWGDLDDPVLRFQMREGFQFCGVIEGYLPTDQESCGYAALIVWLNAEYRGNRSIAGRTAARPGQGVGAH